MGHFCPPGSGSRLRIRIQSGSGNTACKTSNFSSASQYGKSYARAVADRWYFDYFINCFSSRAATTILLSKTYVKQWEKPPNNRRKTNVFTGCFASTNRMYRGDNNVLPIFSSWIDKCSTFKIISGRQLCNSGMHRTLSLLWIRILWIRNQLSFWIQIRMCEIPSDSGFKDTGKISEKNFNILQYVPEAYIIFFIYKKAR